MISKYLYYLSFKDLNKICVLMIITFVVIFLCSKDQYKASIDNNLRGNSERNNSDNGTIRYDLKIIVLVVNRAESLVRLLNSINAAEYESDKVKLDVWIDRTERGNVDYSTLKAARTFSFRHGDYKVNIHSQKVGLLGQWLLPWKPKSGSEEIAVILEDDLTVSKFFYKYLKAVHQKYDHRSDVNGYTLQASQITFAVNSNTVVKCPQNGSVFLYPVLGSWGFSPNNKNWNHFLEWYSSATGNKNIKPYLPGHKATVWFKALELEGKADTMWTIWHIYHAWKYNEFTLYYNFQGNRGLAANWRERGLHYKKTIGATNDLLTEWKTNFARDLPDDLVYIDISGNQIMN